MSFIKNILLLNLSAHLHVFTFSLVALTTYNSNISIALHTNQYVQLFVHVFATSHRFFNSNIYDTMHDEASLLHAAQFLLGALTNSVIKLIFILFYVIFKNHNVF